MKILMCRPDYYEIEYEINPWMNIHSKANSEKALQQWETLYALILKCGAEIDLIPPVKGLPDMVFTANAGLFYKKQIILSRFKHKERQGELSHLQTWFIESGYTILNPFIPQNLTPYFEGAGDALLAGDQLFAAFGFRTDYAFYQQANYIDRNNTVFCELINPYFYHLDTCFCPLNDKQALWYPNAFSQDTQSKLRAHLQLIAVTEAEAKHFACNAVVINENVILPENCPTITAQLERLGFKVHACEMGEYLKAGGACKCLTLVIG